MYLSLHVRYQTKNWIEENIIFTFEYSYRQSGHAKHWFYMLITHLKYLLKLLFKLYSLHSFRPIYVHVTCNQ